MQKKIFALALALCLVFAFAACGGGTSSASTPAAGGGSSAAAGGSSAATGGDVEPVRIAALFSATGAGADNGIYSAKSMDVAAKLINDLGGIQSMGGAKIEIVHADIMSDVNQCKTVAERVLNDGSIMAGVGAAASSYVIPMLPVFEKAGIPYLTACVADAISQSGYHYVIQTCNVNSVMSDGIYRFIAEMNEKYPDVFNVKKVAFVYENTEYGQTQVDGMEAGFLGAGYEIVYKESYPPGLADASSLTAQLIQAAPDLVVPTATVQDAKTILNSFSSMDFYPLIQAGGAGFLMPTFAAEMGDAVDGMVSSAMENWELKHIKENPILQQFIDAYEEEVGEWPVEHAVANMNCVYLIWQALEQNPTYDPETLLDTVRGLKIVNMMPGETTNFHETQGQNLNADVVILQWQKDPEDGIFKTFSIWPERDAGTAYQVPGTT